MFRRERVTWMPPPSGAKVLQSRMPKPPVMQDTDDYKDSLREIAIRHQRPIVSLLLEIQPYQESQQHFFSFLRDLECFVLDKKRKKLYRSRIDAFQNADYVAVSYTWNPSQDEDPSANEYSVQTRNWIESYPSPVRNCIFRRIAKYMDAQGVEQIWIDRHSIPQRVCKSPDCRHRKCGKKRVGLQCMDWVYKLSKYPIALLGRCLKSRRELKLLDMIMGGGFTVKSHRAGLFHSMMKEALRLLFAITNDLWWQRAWTFQENYKGGKEMILLICHPPAWEGQKRRYRTFGGVPGELCIRSQLFSDKATELCQAYRFTTHPTLKEEEMIKSVLNRAGRYTLLLDVSQSMSPTIIADVEKRGVKNAWDRLAIVGNCCSYPVRMDIERLRRSGYSLSLSMLAMCLLNGEILDNRPSDKHTPLNITVSEFLKAQSFDRLSSPLEQRGLTFNKGSRFINVKLNKSGILTKGHLWRLGRIIQTAHFNHKHPRVYSPRGELTSPEQRYLAQLAQNLKTYRESRDLAGRIAEYLREDAFGCAPFQTGENYMCMMMVEVSNAIKEGKTLRLGSLVGSDECMAIFICESDDQPGFVFTSSRPKNHNSETHEANDTDRHVSLAVDWSPERAQDEKSIPHLYTKHCIFGICFFTGRPREDVVFPWPAAWKSIGFKRR